MYAWQLWYAKNILGAGKIALSQTETEFQSFTEFLESVLPSFVGKHNNVLNTLNGNVKQN